MRRANGIPGLSPIVAMTSFLRNVPPLVRGVSTKRTLQRLPIVVVKITVREKIRQKQLTVNLIDLALIRKTMTATAAL